MKKHIYMILAAICLGTIGVLVKLIGPVIPAMTLNFLRLFLGFLFLLPIVPFLDKTTFKPSKKELKEYFMIGLVFAIAV